MINMPCLTSCHRCRSKGYTAVLRNYEDNWQQCAENWAAYGRAACWAMGIDTNNHLERWFGLLKITILRRKRLPQLAMLATVLVEDVMLPSLEARLAKLAQLERSGAFGGGWAAGRGLASGHLVHVLGGGGSVPLGGDDVCHHKAEGRRG